MVLNFQVSESENREDPSDGAAKKRRRRRKKNTEEEGASDAQVRWPNVRFLLLLASARCFFTKIAVWKQTAKLGAAPADIPAPASKKQNPSFSSSQSRCQQLLLSPGLNMHFYPSFNSCGGGVFPCRGVSAEHAASQTLPEEKGRQGNLKPDSRITCKWLSDAGNAITTKHWRLFLSQSNGFISYHKKSNVRVGLRKEVKMWSYGLKSLH